MSIRIRVNSGSRGVPTLVAGALLFGAGVAPAGPAAATQPTAAPAPLYSGLKPDEFMKRWLVLAPIPVASDPSPDEATQKKAFGADLLATAGGESGVEPRPGSKATVAGRELEWRLVESGANVVELYLGETLPPRDEPKAVATPSAQALAAIVGRYDYGGAILEVTREGDRLFAQLTGQPKFEIFPRSDTTFFWKAVEAEVSFVKNDEGAVTKAIHRQGGQTIDAPRMEEQSAAAVDPKAYDALVGRYDYGGGKAILSVTREGDRLFAQLTGQPKFEIFPKSETEFFWKVVNAQVTFVKDANGKVTKAIHQQAGNRFEAPKLE